MLNRVRFLGFPRRYNIYTYAGSDAPWVAASRRPQDNVFTNNTVVGGREGLKLTMADGTEFINNTFKNVKVVRFQNSTGTVMSDNAGLNSVELKVTDGSCFKKKSGVVFYHPVC